MAAAAEAMSNRRHEDGPDQRLPRVYLRPLPVEAIRALTRPGVIDPRWRLADRLLLRWGATPDEKPAGHRSLLAPPSPRTTFVALPEVDCELVDKTVRNSNFWAKRFAILWYRAGATRDQVLEDLKIKRRQGFSEYQNDVLAYYQGMFVALRVNRPGWPRA